MIFFFFFSCLVFVFLDGFHLFIEIQHPDRDKTPWFPHSFGLIIIIGDTRKYNRVYSVYKFITKHNSTSYRYSLEQDETNSKGWINYLHFYTD